MRKHIFSVRSTQLTLRIVPDNELRLWNCNPPGILLPEKNMTKHLYLIAAYLAIWATIPPAKAQDMPAEYQVVLKALDKKGDYKENVLKVNIPRNDLNVTV